MDLCSHLGEKKRLAKRRRVDPGLVQIMLYYTRCPVILQPEPISAGQMTMPENFIGPESL